MDRPFWQSYEVPSRLGGVDISLDSNSLQKGLGAHLPATMGRLSDMAAVTQVPFLAGAGESGLLRDGGPYQEGGVTPYGERSMSVTPFASSLVHGAMGASGCSVLQCVVVCCSMLWFVAVCCSVLQCVAVCDAVCQFFGAWRDGCIRLYCVVVCSVVLWCVVA